MDIGVEGCVTPRSRDLLRRDSRRYRRYCWKNQLGQGCFPCHLGVKVWRLRSRRLLLLGPELFPRISPEFCIKDLTVEAFAFLIMVPTLGNHGFHLGFFGTHRAFLSPSHRFFFHPSFRLELYYSPFSISFFRTLGSVFLIKTPVILVPLAV